MGIKRKAVTKVSSDYIIKTPDVEIACCKLFDMRKNIIVTNISWGFHGLHECDLFLVRPSGHCTEVEIKVSKQDFLKDFEKKHGHASDYIKDFYYAMPDILYAKVKDQIPEHAGAIVCSVYNKHVIAKIVKEPISNNKAKKITLEDELKILRLATMRFWKYKEDLNKIKRA